MMRGISSSVAGVSLSVFLRAGFHRRAYIQFGYGAVFSRHRRVSLCTAGILTCTETP